MTDEIRQIQPGDPAQFSDAGTAMRILNDAYSRLIRDFESLGEEGFLDRHGVSYEDAMVRIQRSMNDVFPRHMAGPEPFRGRARNYKAGGVAQGGSNEKSAPSRSAPSRSKSDMRDDRPSGGRSITDRKSVV